MRIASLQPSITLILKSLDRLDLLCGCTRYCLEAIPELEGRGVSLLHDSWTANTEEILACKPDLVLASIPYRLESLAAILKTGLPVLTLAPHCLDDIYTDIRLIASLVDARVEGDALIQRMQQAIEETRTATTHLAEEQRPLVYCEEWGKPMIHSQAWVAELIEAAGGRFLGTPGAHTDAATIAAAKPDVLLFAWCGAGDRVPLAKVVAQRGWERLEPATRRRVHCVPDQFSIPPRRRCSKDSRRSQEPSTHRCFRGILA